MSDDIKQENFNCFHVGCLFIVILLVVYIAYSLKSCKKEKYKEITILEDYNQSIKKQKSTLANNVEIIKKSELKIEKTKLHKEIDKLNEEIATLNISIKKLTKQKKNLISEKNLLITEKAELAHKYEKLYKLIPLHREFQDLRKKLKYLPSNNHK